MSAPYKMKGFSGFGNEKKSPAKQTTRYDKGERLEDIGKRKQLELKKKNEAIAKAREKRRIADQFIDKPINYQEIGEVSGIKTPPGTGKNAQTTKKVLEPKAKNPLKQKATNKKEYTTAQKRRVVEMNKKHKGKPGFQEYADKVFGGPTTFSGDDGMISKTTKPITAKK